MRWVVLFLLVGLVACGEGDDNVERSGEPGWVQGPAGRLRVSDGGTGEPAVLFIHSLGGRHTQWAFQLEHLRRARRAVAYDMRGHGESDPTPEDGYSLEAMAADTRAVVRSLGLERVIVVGHSLGAAVAAVYAGEHPPTVAGLVLLDPVGEQRRAREEIEDFVSRLRSGPYRETIEGYWRTILGEAGPEVRGAVLADLGRASPEAVIGGLEATLSFDPGAELREYGGPAVVIRTPLNDFPYSVHRVVEGIPTEIVGETSHWLQLDRPAQVNALLDDFIGKVEAAER